MDDFSGNYVTDIKATKMPEYGTPPQEPENSDSGFGIISLVCGCLSMTICCCGGIILAILGFVFAAMSHSRREKSYGFMVGGIITSLIGAILCVVFWVCGGWVPLLVLFSGTQI